MLTNGQPSIFTYLNILSNYKRLIIVFMIGVSIIVTIISFLLPNWYYSYSIIKPAEDRGINIFSAVLGAKGLSSIGKNLGVGSLQYSDLDYYQSLLSSRRVTIKLINKFHLKNVYEQEYLFKTIKELLANSDFQSEVKSNLLVIGVYDKDPSRAKNMVDQYLLELENVVKEISDFSSGKNREFIEKRYFQNRSDLAIAETNMKDFQNKYGVIVPEEQFGGTIKAYAEIVAQKILLESQISSIKAILGEDSPNLIGLFAQKKTLERQEDEYKAKSDKIAQGDFFISINKAPDLISKYIALYREVEIQNKFLEIVYPLYEEAKMEENKNAPAFVVIDKSFIPEYKVKPKRALIIGSSIVFGFLLICSFIFLTAHLKKLKANR